MTLLRICINEHYGFVCRSYVHQKYTLMVFFSKLIMHLSKRKLENDLAQITMIAAKELIELYPASTYQLPTTSRVETWFYSLYLGEIVKSLLLT